MLISVLAVQTTDAARRGGGQARHQSQRQAEGRPDVGLPSHL